MAFYYRTFVHHQLPGDHRRNMDFGAIENRQKPHCAQYLHTKKCIGHPRNGHGIAASPQNIPEKSGFGVHAHESGFRMVSFNSDWPYRCI